MPDTPKPDRRLQSARSDVRYAARDLTDAAASHTEERRDQLIAHAIARLDMAVSVLRQIVTKGA